MTWQAMLLVGDVMKNNYKSELIAAYKNPRLKLCLFLLWLSALIFYRLHL